MDARDRHRPMRKYRSMSADPGQRIADYLRLAGLELEDLRGLDYNPLTRRASLKASVAVNYLVSAVKPA